MKKTLCLMMTAMLVLTAAAAADGCWPGQRTGTVHVYCYDESGVLLQGGDIFVAQSGYVDPPQIGGCTAISGSQYVALDPYAGTCSPADVVFWYRRGGADMIPQLPGGGCPLSLRNRWVERIQPQCGPGYQYKVFASMSGSTRLYKPADITYLMARFCVGDWVYVEFGYTDGVTRYGFFAKSLFDPRGSWGDVPSYTLSGERHGTVTGEVTPRNNPGIGGGSYSSCTLYRGDTVHACVSCNGWYLCRFWNDHTNHYGDVYLWVPGNMIRWD